MIYWFKVLLLLIFLSSYIIAQDYKPGELLVLSKHSLINALIQSPTSSQSQLFLDQYNIKSIKKVTVKKPSSVHSSISPLLTFDENGMYQLEFEDTTLDMEQVATDFESSRDIVWAQPNYIYTLQSTPNDPAYLSMQWNMPMIHYDDDVFAYVEGNSSVVVAVIDSGIDLTHPDLQDAVWTNPNEIPDNGIDDDENGYIDDVRGWNFIDKNNDPSDDNSHGSHVSGIIAAKTNNQIGMAGICSGCSVMTLKSSDKDGRLTSLDVYFAIFYAVNNGANILNLSFGADQSNLDTDSEHIMKYSIDMALSNDCLVIAAAGNISSDVSNFVPASYEGVIAVSSIGHTGVFADNYSNFGDRIDITAPGGTGGNVPASHNIYSTIPNSTYDSYSGTSMAAPHIAGMAGLLMSTYPDITSSDVKKALFNSATDLGDSEKDPLYGHGMIHVKHALTYLDTEGPVFDHDHLTQAAKANDILITATAIDAMKSSSLPIVTLFYRYTIDNVPISLWHTATMTKLGDDYSYTISNSDDAVTAIDYYFQAIDLKPNETHLPVSAPKEFYTIMLNTEFGSLQSISDINSLKVFGPLGEQSAMLTGPNPFNPAIESTYIQYELSQDADINLYIYSISGESLWHRHFSSGDPQGGTASFHSIEWSGRNDFGEVVANGPYILYLIARTDSDTKIIKTKILVLK